MYRKGPKGIFKHYDFAILDMICLQLSFVAAYIIRHGFANPYLRPIYQDMAIYLELADVVVLVICGTLKNVLKRGYWKEFSITFRHMFGLAAFAALYLFTVNIENYSRVQLYLTMILYFILTFSSRVLWKEHLKKKMVGGGDRSLVIVTNKALSQEVLKGVKDKNYKMYRIAGVIILDTPMQGQEVEGIPVVADCDNMLDYICREWVDEVFLILPPEEPYPQELLNQFSTAGVTVSLNLVKLSNYPGMMQQINRIGDYTVLTTGMRYTTIKEAALKRTLDIFGGIIGCLLTIIICIIVGPIIYISSPGPIFFKQIRIGRNGKKFKMYKFRSMYLDAEERKKELMEQNKVESGLMFKMDFDPRVIGNKILPDGSTRTGIGQFIRSTSLDEFPQFFNVLKGDMSLVGTRPPTEDEWVQYEYHHRTRMAIKPGITGLWQVSGRSEISDFEEVVKLDNQYINEWSIGKDIKILLKTVFKVLKREGSV